MAAPMAVSVMASKKKKQTGMNTEILALEMPKVD
jgi:hypothetical protein